MLSPDRGLVAALCFLLLPACGGGLPAAPPADTPPRSETAAQPASGIEALAGDDVVVIAVIDTAVNPYHYDNLASRMPQHLDADPDNDLPLHEDPSTWVPGYPAPAEFNRFGALNLTLVDDNDFQRTDELYAQDAAEWAKVAVSQGNSNADVNMYWIPGTKVIGHVTFKGGDGYAASSHGVGTSSVSVGNLYGSCPNCLLVFVHGSSREQANEWVASQDWIDAQTNSWGLSLVSRDRVYAGSDTEAQRAAVERGQSIFFSAGNGQGNAFVAPNTTLQSSQEGPDWIITVGAISPDDNSSYSGHGKPADIASIGRGYPSAYNGNDTVNARGNFSGTSNATPVVAGLYGEALYRLRRRLDGPSRLQAGGVIARGPAACGAANADCALADGELTVHELREALFRAARHTAAGTNVGGLVTLPQSENLSELEFMSEGHGSYLGRLRGDETWNEEVERIVAYAMGDWYEDPDPDQLAWFAADAYCRQSVWGSWDFGEDQKAPVPAPDPAWPLRSFLTEACPSVIGAVVAAERLLP